MSALPEAPLHGVLVLDLTRMLPGAVLARQLLEMGARLIKVEDPTTGDPMRHAPPLHHGMGAGFSTMYSGAESLGLDLREPADAARLRRVAASADVLVESFRPGTMEDWGLGYGRLAGRNPGLVYCALSSFGQQGPWAQRVGHDLNFAGLSGLWDLLGSMGVPGVQMVDVTSGLMACAAIVGALLARQRGGQGRLIDQPLSRGVLPHLVWGISDQACGQAGVLETVLAGRCPCYGVYPCGDGKRLVLGAIEPKFWAGFVELLGLGDLAGLGWDSGEKGRRAAEAVKEALAQHPRRHWISLCQEAGLPITPINDLPTALEGGYLGEAGLTAEDPHGQVEAGPLHPSVGARPSRPAPTLGQHTQAVLQEFGLE